MRLRVPSRCATWSSPTRPRLTTTSATATRSRSPPGRWLLCAGRRAPASRRSSRCSSASTTRRRGASSSTASTSRRSTCAGSARASGSWARSRSSSSARLLRTSRMASPRGPPKTRLRRRRARPMRTPSSQTTCPTGTQPRWVRAAASSRAGRSSAWPSRAPSSSSRRCCCWTRPPRRSTRPASGWCRRRWMRSWSGPSGLPSQSPTGFPPLNMQTRSR
mmetsp:Transcript_5775/g.18398  ORF Transcript_5775/g.18398 Transcript_5775/m.18398 type:complete len:219 (+) Transcript_5775:1622-2278(+)